MLQDKDDFLMGINDDPERSSDVGFVIFAFQLRNFGLQMFS